MKGRFGELRGEIRHPSGKGGLQSVHVKSLGAGRQRRVGRAFLCVCVCGLGARHVGS